MSTDGSTKDTIHSLPFPPATRCSRLIIRRLLPLTVCLVRLFTQQRLEFLRIRQPHLAQPPYPTFLSANHPDPGWMNVPSP